MPVSIFSIKNIPGEVDVFSCRVCLCLGSTIDKHRRNLRGLFEVTGDVSSNLLKSNFLRS